MNARLATVKTILWTLMGVLAAVTAARFLFGLGATTALSDAVPWGFWIAFDVMSGVALAAGGFVMAGTVYIFGGERYRPFVRPAILTALLGYIAVAVGLLYDLGLPWHIWHPIVYPQHHSVLFEVAMCVMIYLTVLGLEFAPVVLEHRWFDRPLFRGIYQLLHKAVIPLVIAGIVLSTLHQSSLGSLFLIAPYRLHPLWYSPIIWILFFVSAIALGLMMVTAESLFSSWLFGHKVETNRLSGLAKAASVVLLLYVVLRVVDLSVRGVIGQAFDGSTLGLLFLFELLVGAVIPAVLMMFHRVRTTKAGLGLCATLSILGIVGYRFNICILAFFRPEGVSYFPSWTELAVSLGIVAGAMLVFIFFVEQLKVYADEHESTPGGLSAADFSAHQMRNYSPPSLSNPRRYSLAALVGAAVTVALLPAGLLSGTQVPSTPVSASRTLHGWERVRDYGAGYDYRIEKPPTEISPGFTPVTLLSIDGNRDGRLVLFPHGRHIEELGGEASCAKCHHLNMPLDTNSTCAECHRDMYRTTDIFDHALHVDKLDGNNGCADCHDDREAKTRQTAASCVECHDQMIAPGSIVSPPAGGIEGFAAGYMDAMHGICITCHEETVGKNPQQYDAAFSECGNCHRDVDMSTLQQTIAREP